MPLNFTLRYADRVNDIDDTTGDVAATPGVGPVYFDTTILPGYRIPDLLSSPPTGLATRRFSGYLDTDGLLKKERGGEEGVRLWANDPAWDLPRLQYRVTAQLTDIFGRSVPWETVYFDAPAEDVVRYLAAEMPKPRQKFGRGRPGYGLARNGLDINEAGQLTLTREDGSSVGAVTVPDLSTALDEAAAISIAHTVTFGRR